jgi:hypothetical protein
VHGDDVRLVELRGGLAVAVETGTELLVVGQLGQEQSERDGAVAAGVPGAVDLARAAVAQELVQLVGAEGLEEQDVSRWSRW